MNKAIKKRLVKENRNKYRIPGGANYQLRTLNAIHLSSAESAKHAMAKCIAAYQLLKYGDIKFDDDLKISLINLTKEMDRVMKEFPKQKANFITEAVIKKQPDRRVDLVWLENDTQIEFETNKKIKKDGAITIYI